MNQSIAYEARRALTANGYPVNRNLCQKFVRLIVQNVVGHQYDQWLWKGTAAKAGVAFSKSPYLHNPKNDVEPGDILYKVTGSGGAGHVGIVLSDGRVAENSTYHWNKSGGRDARGIRTLAQFGGWNVTVRLPDPKPQPAPSTESTLSKTEIVIAYPESGNLKPTRLPLIIRDGVGYAPVQATCDALGVETVRGTWGKDTIAIVRKD